jgi:hypothetical protein
MPASGGACRTNDDCPSQQYCAAAMMQGPVGSSVQSDASSTIALGFAREYPRVCEPSQQHGEQLCR